MKTKRLCVYVLCVVILLSLCSCGFIPQMQYHCEIENVESIQIVRLGDYVQAEYRFDYTVLSSIDDCSTFVNKLNSVKCSENWGSPLLMPENGVVIRIAYQNGDYDLLHPDAQHFYKNGVSNYGYFFFNTEQFNALIAEYWTDDSQSGS